MKKTLIIAAMSLVQASFAQAVVTDLVMGTAVTADTTNTKPLMVKNAVGATSLKFNNFPATLSKGVSVATQDDTTNARVVVQTSHFASNKIYGGSSSGGAVTECTVAFKSARNSDLTAVVTDTTCVSAS